mgnify:CR=1 FL=1
MSKACNICGFKENPLDALFCGACGSKLPKAIDIEKAKGISKIITSVLNHARNKEDRSIIPARAEAAKNSKIAMDSNVNEQHMR